MKYAEQNFVFKQVSYKYVFNVFWVGRERGWGGRLFEVGANSRLANMVLFCWMVIYPVDSIIHLLNNQGHTILYLVQASKVKCEARGEQDIPCPSPSSFTHLSQLILAWLSFACLKRNSDITCSAGYTVSTSHKYIDPSQKKFLTSIRPLP